MLITSAPDSPDRDLNRRQARYLALMALRVVCFVAAAFLPGVWRWVAVAGAAFLPGIAVVIANAIDLRAKHGGEVPVVTPQDFTGPALEASPRTELPLVISAEPEPEQHYRDDAGPGGVGPPYGPD